MFLQMVTRPSDLKVVLHSALVHPKLHNNIFIYTNIFESKPKTTLLSINNMTNIHLTSSDKNPVTVQFAFHTPQQFFYNVSVVTPANVQIFHDSGQWDGKTLFELGAAETLIGNYLT